MSTAVGIGVVALIFALGIVVGVGRRRQKEVGAVTTWSDARSAFSADALNDLRGQSVTLADPKALDSDVRVGHLLADLAEEGSGYLQPRDLLTSRSPRS